MALPSEMNQTAVAITAADVPLHCPLPSQKLWNTHPRVFLPIVDAPEHTVRCPYCGTVYTLTGPLPRGH
jgi:uncharacterized Zn-finger protein